MISVLELMNTELSITSCCMYSEAQRETEIHNLQLSSHTYPKYSYKSCYIVKRVFYCSNLIFENDIMMSDIRDFSLLRFKMYSGKVQNLCDKRSARRRYSVI